MMYTLPKWIRRSCKKPGWTSTISITTDAMAWCHIATDARASVTKHCGYDAMHLIGCCISCLPPCSRNVCSCWCPDSYTSDSHCYNFHARVSIAVGFVDVQPDFLQVLLTQIWVKCTSLDALTCVVYSGIRFRAIRAASKRIEQGQWWKVWFGSGPLLFSLLIILLKFFLWTIGHIVFFFLLQLVVCLIYNNY